MSNKTTNTMSDDEANKKRVFRRPPEVDQYVDTFLSAICDSSRRHILELLAMPGNADPKHISEKRSGDIARQVGLSAATTSEHLRQLTDLGLLTSRKEKNTVYYRLSNQKVIQAFHDFLMGVDQDYATRQKQ